MKNIYAFYTDEKYKNLTPTAKSVYTLIYNQYTLSLKNINKGFKDENGVFCFLSQKKIADMLGKTDRTIRRAFSQLKEVGLINVIERGCRKLAKIYVNTISKATKKAPVKIEAVEVKEAFEETFGEKANSSEAKALNDLTKSNKIEDLVEAIKRSKEVIYKNARIKYIKKALVTVIEENKNPIPAKSSQSKRVIRQEKVPSWLKPGYKAPEKKAVTDLESELFELQKESFKVVGTPKFNEYTKRIEELKLLIKTK